MATIHIHVDAYREHREKEIILGVLNFICTKLCPRAHSFGMKKGAIKEWKRYPMNITF